MSATRLILSPRTPRTFLGAPRGLHTRKGSSSFYTRILKPQQRGILTESWAQGPSSPPLLTQTIPQHFASIVSQHGDRTAVISRGQNERLSYKELDERSNALARGLRAQGVGKGDRVAVSLGNNWEFAVVTYAVWKLGAILVPLNPAFNSIQVISALNHLEAAHLIIGMETNLPYKPSRDNISLFKELVPDFAASKLHSESVASLQNIILVNNSSPPQSGGSIRASTDFADILLPNSTKSVDPDSPLHMDDTINIQFTSGTTSSPKAACLTHHSILNNGHSIGARMALTPEDIICCPPPLFHCFGSILGYMASATHGSCILFPSEAFSPLSVLQSIQEEGATALYGVATMFIAELELLANGTVEPTGFERLRTGIAAGSSVPSHLMEKLHNVLNLRGLTICYGMTETSPVSCMTTPDDPLQKRVDSVGRLLPRVEAKIVDVHDSGKIVPIGEKGELVVSGYNVMKGYWNDHARTDEVRTVEPILENEEQVGEKVWMFTGDEAEMDGDGYVKITGRIKDLIIRGGENIHPLEVENCLFRHTSVGEVSVVGLPDEKYGECVAAFIVVRQGREAGPDDSGVSVQRDGRSHVQLRTQTKGEVDEALTKESVRDWVRGELSGHLVPKYVFWVKDYPKTASGKIQKFKLKEMGIKLLEDAKTI